MATTAATLTSSAVTEGESGGNRYSVQIEAIDGATDDGAGTWKAQAAQLNGGDERFTNAFNVASRNSVTGLIDNARADASSDSWTLEATSRVTFQPEAVSQSTVGVYYAKGAAHPLYDIATVVIDSRDGRPITLQSLFINEQDGLNRLSVKAGVILGVNNETGLRPIEKNFANWIPTAAGFEIHFADYQLGHGLRVTTIPWSYLVDLLAPNMTALAQK
ncbi:DUF3298 domain-containing protein [Mycobacteroides salmoniphilum]|uniref:DUF3298 domain-containing protein n=1 Tax=Mycobacteroides salmoniphilum TaxID=404941 RepID=UPI001F30509C|nr:DUF3298 domain-containing protein [Mycobacteroides salmoniphilum]